MSRALYHFTAIVVIGCALITAFSIAYPAVAIDGGLVSMFVLVAILVEGSMVLAYRRITRRR